MKVTQGHRYRISISNREVMAMESAPAADVVRVREIKKGCVWQQLGDAEIVPANKLTALPMRYFHGQVPK